MTVHIASWAWPLAATLLLWFGVVVAPVPEHDGHYDIARGLASLAWIALGLFLTPCIWLVWALLTRN